MVPAMVLVAMFLWVCKKHWKNQEHRAGLRHRDLSTAYKYQWLSPQAEGSGNLQPQLSRKMAPFHIEFKPLQEAIPETLFSPHAALLQSCFSCSHVMNWSTKGVQEEHSLHSVGWDVTQTSCPTLLPQGCRNTRTHTGKTALAQGERQFPEALQVYICSNRPCNCRLLTWSPVMNGLFMLHNPIQIYPK